MYVYCNNNPINFKDETGTEFSLASFIVGAVVVVAVIFTAIVNNNTDSDIGSTVGGLIEDAVDLGININKDIASKATSWTKTKTKTKTTTKTETKTKKKDKTQYWSADSNAHPMDSLTYAQAKNRVSVGKNIICANQIAAYSIAKWYPNRKLDNPHGKDYYYHYHINSKLHGEPHIWFIGPKIFNY